MYSSHSVTTTSHDILTSTWDIISQVTLYPDSQLQSDKINIFFISKQISFNKYINYHISYNTSLRSVFCINYNFLDDLQAWCHSAVKVFTRWGRLGYELELVKPSCGIIRCKGLQNTTQCLLLLYVFSKLKTFHKCIYFPISSPTSLDVVFYHERNCLLLWR